MSIQEEKESGKLAVKLAVEEVTELAAYFGVPQILVNHYVIKFVGTDKAGNRVENLYFKLPYYLAKADPKKGGRGIQSMRFDETQKGDEWEVKVTIYPQVTSRVFEQLVKIQDKEERQKYWEYLTLPIIEKGTASPRNVKMSTMQQHLREIAIKRGVVRALRWMVNSGDTAYEELPEVELSQVELSEAREMAKNAKSIGGGPAVEGRPPLKESVSGQEIPSPQFELTPEYLLKFPWYYGEGKETRAWKPTDEWGWAHTRGFGTEFLEIAKPVIELISRSYGAVVVGDEMISFDEQKAHLLRRRVEGTL